MADYTNITLRADVGQRLRNARLPASQDAGKVLNLSDLVDWLLGEWTQNRMEGFYDDPPPAQTVKAAAEAQPSPAET